MHSDLYNKVAPYYASRIGWYHNLSHINKLLEEAFTRSPNHRISRELYTAILFHDIVYDIPLPGTKLDISNEKASAALYKKIYGIGFEQRVVDMIEATEHHFDHSVYTDHEICFLLDLDILGFSNPNMTEFLTVQQHIDKEYIDNGYSTAEIVEGRLKFMTHIYDTNALQYRVVDNIKGRTKQAYQNIELLMSLYERRVKVTLN